MRPHPIFLSLATIIGCLLAGEMALRVARYPENPVVGWRTVHDLNRTVDASRYYPRSELNQLGFRGQRISYGSQDLVVLLVGDSQVESTNCTRESMPERFLEASLRKRRDNVRVFTIGASGYGQDQELLGLKNYFSRFRADLVIVWLTIGNDSWNNLFPSHSASSKEGVPKPTYRLTASGLVGPNREIGERLFRTQLHALFFRAVYGDLHAYWERFLPPPYKPLRAPEGHYAEIVHTDEGVETEDSHWLLFLTPDSPRKEYAIALFRALLREISNLCWSHGARLVLLEVDRWTPIGTAARHNFPFWRPGVRFVEKDKKYYRADSRKYSEALRKLTAGFELLTVPITVPHHVTGENDTHLNETGNRQAMSGLAEALTDRGLIH